MKHSGNSPDMGIPTTTGGFLSKIGCLEEHRRKRPDVPHSLRVCLKSIGKAYSILLWIISFHMKRPEIGGHPSFLDLKTGLLVFQFTGFGSTSHQPLCSEEELWSCLADRVGPLDAILRPFRFCNRFTAQSIWKTMGWKIVIRWLESLSPAQTLTYVAQLFFGTFFPLHPFSTGTGTQIRSRIFQSFSSRRSTYIPK